MGEAKRRQRQAQTFDYQFIEAVGGAIRKLASAASGYLGGDCYLHAAIGKELLASNGIQAEIAAGLLVDANYRILQPTEQLARANALIDELRPSARTHNLPK